ncbi:GNAT family N-acetyltransferase [Roseibium sp. RKSG952]|uniref:GNAT family N-acetyltransferase n=1 Tax=Roseibium sp. RKSG952 TaxID=2529384 RepID=UPI0012BC22D2|nr:GNAT family N-acetyltransferase [Roseibium sp. RKSG952]MTI00049.1 N-acetyltransferase family protein [Roseibium sp. RKSG952]
MRHEPFQNAPVAENTSVKIRPAELRDLPALLAIYNHAVAHLTALWTDRLEDLDGRRSWLLARRNAGFPVLVAVDGEDQVLGYGSYGWFRPADGYRKTVEHSVYVNPGLQGGGIGTALLKALIDHAKSAGMHVMIAAIDGENGGSIRFHEQHGFAESGRLPQAGTKFGRWLDLVLMTRVLDVGDTPASSMSAKLDA